MKESPLRPNRLSDPAETLRCNSDVFLPYNLSHIVVEGIACTRLAATIVHTMFNFFLLESMSGVRQDSLASL